MAVPSGSYRKCQGTTSSSRPKQGQEVVNNPPHYHSKCSDAEMKRIIDRIVKRGYIEAIDVIDAFFRDNFDLGTAFRYLARLGAKDDEITELEKSDWYIRHEIELRKQSRYGNEQEA